jgi:hypothetical protein
LKKLSTVAILCGLLCACQKSFEWQAPEKGDPAREDVSIFSRPGVELGPYRRLRKMSRRLRGIDPSPEDLNRLREILAAPEAQQAESLNTFFAQMARSYASSEFATELMVYRTMELLRVKGPLSSPASRVNYPALLQEWKATTDNATVFLIRDVIEKISLGTNF